MRNNRNRCGPPKRWRWIGYCIIISGLMMVCFALDWSLIAFIGCLLCVIGTAAAVLL